MGAAYGTSSGTSLASPVAAGVLALVFGANPTLTASQAQGILLASADDLGAAGWDPYFGSGRVNAYRAVQAALGVTSTDTTPPTDSILSPSSGTTVAATVSVAVSASDNVGVTKVELYIDGALKGTSSTAPFTFNWDTTSVADGGHTLSSKAYDAANNAGASTQVAVQVSNAADTTPPAVAISAPLAGATVSGVTTVSASASDNVGVTKVELYVDGVLKATDTASPYSFSWDTTGAANGTHSLTARAYDAASNATTSAAVSVTVSNAAALVTQTFTGSVGGKNKPTSATHSFAVSSSGQVSATLTWGSSRTTLHMVVRDSAGNVVASGSATSLTSETLSFLAAPGSYTLTVSVVKGSGSYTLTVTHP
jgi:hypothetical protein